MIQASDSYSNNLKLRLDPRLSIAFKYIRHATIPQLHKENVFENDMVFKHQELLSHGKRIPLSYNKTCNFI